MKAIRLIALLLALVLFCGCQAQLNREYSSVKLHEEQFEVDQYSDALTAENYLGLKNAILSFVETGENYGVLRIYDYDGNVVSDLANAVYEVCHTDPLGAYAVDYMTYDYAHIVSYYEIYIYTTFRIAASELSSIIRCSNSAAVEAELENALLNRNYQLALRISNYSEFDPAELFHRLFMAHPELGISEPAVSYHFYPDSGIQRILEIDISYPNDALSMISRQSRLAEKAEEIASLLSVYPRESQKIQRLYRWFVDHVTYMGEDSTLFGSAYHALVNEYGSSPGIALAVQLLCDTMDIPCFIVEGQYNSAPWLWNLVYVDDLWQHMDVSRGIVTEQSVYQPMFDADMTNYRWDTSIYPVCPTPEEDSEQAPTETNSDPLAPEDDSPTVLFPYPDPEQDGGGSAEIDEEIPTTEGD